MKVANNKMRKVRWALDYNEDKVEKGTAMRIGGNVSGSRNSLEKVFNYYSYQRKSAKLKNRFMHLKVAVSPQDKNLSSRIIRQIGERVVQGLGYKNNPFIIYRHFDTEHDHIHIVLSRVTFDGKLVRDSYDGLKLKRLEEKLAKEFELTPSFGRLLSPAKVRTGQRQEKESIKKHKDLPLRAYIQNAVMESILDRPTHGEFLARLERRGVVLVRHKFNRGSKVHYGLSYTLNPKLIKAEFKTLAMADRVGGMESMSIAAQGIDFQMEHPFLGMSKGNFAVDNRGIPQLCRESSQPPKQLKPVSYRAANLGPFFQLDSILSLLSGNGERDLDRITVERKKSKKNEDFSIKLLTESESVPLSSLIRAAEMRSEERVIESIKSGASIDDVLKTRGTIHKKDVDFVKAILETSLAKEIGKEKKVPVQKAEQFSTTESKNINEIERLLRIYSAKSGKTINPTTYQAAKLIVEENWAELEKLIQGSQANSITQAPDPFIFSISLTPPHLRRKLSDYSEWFADESIGYSESENSISNKKEKADTALLINAIQLMDINQILHIMATGSPKVKDVPLALITKITDARLKRTLTMLNTGIIPDSIPVQGNDQSDISQNDQSQDIRKGKDHTKGKGTDL